MKLATNDRSDKMFPLTSNFVPKGLSAPSQVLYRYKIINKKIYKIRLQRYFFKLVANDRSDKRFLLTSKFCPLGLSPLICDYIHVLNHEKMYIKSEVKEILFKLATNDHSDEGFMLTSKFWHYWVVYHCPRSKFHFLLLNNH